MQKFRYTISLSVFSFLAFMLGFGLRQASAQEHTPQQVPPYREDHVDQIQKWYEEFTNPEHEPDIQQRRLAGLAQMRQMDNRPAMKAASSAAWVSAGSSTSGGNVSGRPTCIAFGPSETEPPTFQTIYLGETFGGLWKSIDNGKNWVSLSDSWQILSVGGIAVDPNDPNVLYAGTGVAQGGITPSDQNGIGIYKSTDGGLNWQLLLDSNKKNPVGTLTNGMAVNPGNSNFVYQACNTGVFLSTNAGATWTHTLAMGGFTSLVLNPLNPAILYAAGNGQMDKSYDSGQTWTTLTGFPPGNLMILAMSLADTGYVYVSSGYNGGAVLSRSTNGGKTWTAMTTASNSSLSNYLGQQGWYANAIAVDPANVNNVAVGGLDIFTSTNGGKTLTKKTTWTDTPGSSDYTHADIHGLAYNGETLYTYTDGGIFHSESKGQSWEQDMNKNLGTFLFVGGDAAPDFSFLEAGAQDNGTNLIHPSDAIYSSTLGGDGGPVNISQTDGQTVYGFFINSQGGQTLLRSIDAGNSFSPQNLLQNSNLNKQNDQWPSFYYEYDVSETDPNTVAVCGGTRLYLTTNGGDDNFPQVTGSGSPSGIVLTGNPRTVAIAKNNPGYLFVGGTNTMYYSVDQGQTWSKTTTALGASPTSITTDLNDETHVYMTVGGTGSKHFFISTDTGHTWKAPTTKLPSLNFRRVAVDQTGQIFIGNDYGVLRSVDNGVTWYQVADGFPQVLITSMHVRSHYLVATTYGRGMWYVDLNLLPQIQSGVSAPAASNSSNAASIAAIYPNPVSAGQAHSTIQFTVQVGTHATLSVYDVLGREEKVLMNEWATQGQHELALDLAGLPAGQHYIVLTADGASVSKPLTIE